MYGLISQVSKWKVGGYTLLIEHRGILKKGARFEEAWRKRRAAWILHVHHGKTKGVIEILPDKEIERERVSGE
jgi:hypothetical protein